MSMGEGVTWIVVMAALSSPAGGRPDHLNEVAQVVMAIADIEGITPQANRPMLIPFREQDKWGAVPVHSSFHCRCGQGIHPCG